MNEPEKCTDTCVDFANGYKLPYNASTPGNYTLPGEAEPLDFGVSPSYLNQSRDADAQAGIVAVFVVALLICGLRLYSRITTRPPKTPRFGWDDAILIITIALYAAFVGLAIACINWGEGRHIEWIILQGMINQHVVEQQEILDFSLHLVYNTALFSCRCSALAFFARLPTPTWMILVGFAIITGFYLPQMFTLIFHCQPVTALWPYDFQVDSSKYTCMSWGLVYLINGCLSVASDLVIFIIPAWLVYVYKATVINRLKLALVLFPGILVIGVSSARLGLLSKGIYYSDQSWYYGPMVALEGAEIGGTMMAISVPALKLFAERTLKIATKYSLMIQRNQELGSGSLVDSDVRGDSLPDSLASEKMHAGTHTSQISALSI